MTAERKKALINAGEASLYTVRTYPEGANVDVDGKLVGQSPISIVLLKGSLPRDVYVYQTGYKIVHRAVQPDGSTLNLSITLEPLKKMN